MRVFSPRNVGDIVAEVEMSRAAFPHAAHVLVEGPSDSQFWRPRLRKTGVQIVICTGKQSVVESIVRLNYRTVPKVLGIVDDDLDSILGKRPPSQDIATTDSHDLETLLLESNALERFLSELAPDAIRDLESEDKRSVREGLVARCLPLGVIRFIAQTQKLEINCSGMPHKFINEKTWALDSCGLVDKFATLTGLQKGELERLMSEVPTDKPWSIIQGHDAVSAVWLLLRVLKTTTILGYEQILLAIRIGYTDDLLAETTIFRVILEWEDRNSILVLGEALDRYRTG